jgi:hypothetical protein
MKIPGLVAEPTAKTGVRLGSIDEVETKNVFLLFRPDMETVSVIRPVGKITTVLENDPIRPAFVFA